MADTSHQPAKRSPEEIQAMREKVARYFRPMHDEEDAERWRKASFEEKGQALVSLLNLVRAIGNYPPKRDEFPGWRKILEERRTRAR